MRNPHAGQNESIFPVAMRCLVQVHEIHIDRVIRQELVGLRMKVKQRLPQDLKSLDPHLRRRERMHPCDHTDTVIITLYLPDILDADLRILNRRKKLNMCHIPDLLIEKCRHLLSVLCHLLQALIPVQILAANDKIQFCLIHHSYTSIQCSGCLIHFHCMNRTRICKQYNSKNICTYQPCSLFTVENPPSMIFAHFFRIRQSFP